jgi:hypothetical protein
MNKCLPKRDKFCGSVKDNQFFLERKKDSNDIKSETSQVGRGNGPSLQAGSRALV